MTSSAQKLMRQILQNLHWLYKGPQCKSFTYWILHELQLISVCCTDVLFTLIEQETQKPRKYQIKLDFFFSLAYPPTLFPFLIFRNVGRKFNCYGQIHFVHHLCALFERCCFIVSSESHQVLFTINMQAPNYPFYCLTAAKV